jgi:hypothetical protein
LRTGESIGPKFAGSLGVNEPERAAAPAAAGTHAHLATNGETEVVATASQPVITLPPNLKATTPALLAVALMVMGSSWKTPLPPDKINVDAAGAATAEPDVTTAPTSAKAAIAILEINFFIIFSSLSWVGKTI